MSGADQYRFAVNSGRDVILGFDQAEGDRLVLEGGQTYTTSANADGSALLTLSCGGTVTLAGVQASQVNDAFFAPA